MGPKEFKGLMNYLTRPSDDKKRQKGYFETNDPKEAAREVIRRVVPIDQYTFPITNSLNLGLGPDLDQVNIGSEFDVGDGTLSVGGGMKGDEKAFGIGFRKEFDGGGPTNKEKIKQLQKKHNLTTASKIKKPDLKKEVKDIKLFNEFNLRNPQADGGRAGYFAGALVNPAVNVVRPVAGPLLKRGAEALAGTAAGKRISDIFFNETFAPDADEIEKTREEIRESLKPGETKPIDTGPIKTGETTPPKIDLTEKFPIGETMKPIAEGFPAETEQLPIIFENKKVENVKKKFDKVIDLYETTGPGGPKRAIEIDKIRNKKFAEDVKDLIDNTYGGNAQALASDLNIERVRINSLFNKHGIKQERAGNKTIQNIFLKQDKNKVSVPELTDNIKENNTYLIDRAKERFVNYEKDKNTFKNYKDIAEIVGVGIPDKTAQDFFQTKLRNANKKIGIRTKKGFGKEILYNLEDAVNALTKVNLTKPIKGTGDIYSKNRIDFEKKIDNAGFGARTYILEQIRDTQKEVLGEETILRAGEQYGHAEALINLKKYSKLFKNSNAADITTLVFQDPVLNVDILQAYGSTKTGIEQKRQPFLNTLEKLIGKKATAENIQIANEALNDLNRLNDLGRAQIKKFQKTNKFVRDQQNRIPDYELTLPKEGETFKSGFLNIDMSSIDPSVSVGKILEINPNAKTFNDLSKPQQNLYRENLRNQITDFLKYFYQESGVDREDILSLEEEILDKNLKSRVASAKGGSMNIDLSFAGGGRAGYNKGMLVEPVEIDFASAEDKAFSDMMNAFKYYIKSGGTKSLKEYMRMSTGAGRKGGGKEHFRGAGGGIAKQAGDRSGPPPESGPNPQGLPGLLKRGMKI